MSYQLIEVNTRTDSTRFKIENRNQEHKFPATDTNCKSKNKDYKIMKMEQKLRHLSKKNNNKQ